MLHAKIHRARVTNKSLDYIGSITVDSDLLDAAGILENEKVLVANLTNGERAETYALAGRAGSGEVCLNGATARLAEVGDLVIVMAFAAVDENDLAGWEPKVVFVDRNNKATPKKKA